MANHYPAIKIGLVEYLQRDYQIDHISKYI